MRVGWKAEKEGGSLPFNSIVSCCGTRPQCVDEVLRHTDALLHAAALWVTYFQHAARAPDTPRKGVLNPLGKHPSPLPKLDIPCQKERGMG